VKHVFSVLLAVLFLTYGEVALAAEDEWRSAISHVEATHAQVLAGDLSGADALSRDLDILTNVIERPGSSDAMRSLAFFYRAEARSLQNAVRVKRNLGIDQALAQGTVADFDKVIALGANPQAIVEAEYGAGVIALNELHQAPLAFSYWERCARAGHPGCLNVMAEAKLTGMGGQQINIQDSLELNSAVFSTGTKYTCAGAYSALMIAGTLHFFGAAATSANDVGDQLTWIDRAYTLLDALAAKPNGGDLCGRFDFEITEFLIRLSHGERRDGLLKQAREPHMKAVAQYIEGSIDDTALRSALSLPASDYESCTAHFEVLWYLELSKRHDVAQEHYDAMSRVGLSSCGVNLTFARKLGFESL
jgi:hypothetical protein